MAEDRIFVELPSATVAALIAARHADDCSLADVIVRMNRDYQLKADQHLLPNIQLKSNSDCHDLAGKYKFDFLGQTGRAELAAQIRLG